MNQFNPNIHKRQSVRLKDYDYSQLGLYFVTICCLDKTCFFGLIENHEMKLNDEGKMIQKWYYELENKFPDIKCHDMIVMPNHIHFIIENVGADLRVRPINKNKLNVGADLRVRPLSNSDNILGEHIDSPPQDVTINKNELNVGADLRVRPITNSDNILGEHIGSPLHQVVQWFKTMTTNEYIRGVKNNGWKPFNGKLWQRSYYEHIIRNSESFHNISEYIKKNPIKWEEDNYFI